MLFVHPDDLAAHGLAEGEPVDIISEFSDEVDRRAPAFRTVAYPTPRGCCAPTSPRPTGPHTALHHVSFEMRGIDEYMRGTGRLLRAGVHKVWGPGRHMAGDNTFSYFLDAHGNTVEYTTELEVLDEDVWHPSKYDVSQPENQDQWGTANPFGEELAKESFNDVDRGCFVAPPV